MTMITGRIFLIVLLPLLLLTSCTEQPFDIDAVTLTPTAVFSRVDDLTLSQSGLLLLISSEDLESKKMYQVRFESPGNTSVNPFIWEQTVPVTRVNDSLALVVNAVLMPGETPFPAGEYTLEIVSPSGMVARQTLAVRTGTSMEFEEAGLDLKEREGEYQLVTGLADTIEWSGEVIVSGKVFSLTSKNPSFQASGDQIEDISVYISYYDDIRKMQIVHRMLTHSTLPTDR
ncbi:MAG: hypothetical protein JXK93_06955 [Sphaerochaetaceae bacterium]|nr:hypothetical protein [Sphaerochaetaceae bacterium]